jgi:tetratricopeptide (TPR) repeat protein
MLISGSLLALLFRKHHILMTENSTIPLQHASLGASVAGIVEPEEDIEESANEDLSFPTNAPSGPIDFARVNQYFRKADFYFSQKRLDEAERWFIKVLSIYPDHEEALNRLGIIYIQNNVPHKAELLFRRLITLRQDEPAYFSNFGRCLYNQKKYKAAADAYERAVRLDTSRISRYISLGQIYYEMQQLDKALEHFLWAHKKEPANAEYIRLVADIYQVMGDNENEKKFLEILARKKPYDERVKDLE